MALLARDARWMRFLLFLGLGTFTVRLLLTPFLWIGGEYASAVGLGHVATVCCLLCALVFRYEWRAAAGNAETIVHKRGDTLFVSPDGLWSVVGLWFAAVLAQATQLLLVINVSPLVAIVSSWIAEPLTFLVLVLAVAQFQRIARGFGVLRRQGDDGGIWSPLIVVPSASSIFSIAALEPLREGVRIPPCPGVVLTIPEVTASQLVRFLGGTPVVLQGGACNPAE